MLDVLLPELTPCFHMPNYHWGSPFLIVKGSFIGGGTHLRIGLITGLVGKLKLP